MPQRGRLILSHFHLSPLRTGMRGAEWIGDYDLRVTQDQDGATDAPEPAASEAHEVPRVGFTYYFGRAVLVPLARLFYRPRICLLYTSPSPRDLSTSRMPSSA